MLLVSFLLMGRAGRHHLPLQLSGLGVLITLASVAWLFSHNGTLSTAFNLPLIRNPLNRSIRVIHSDPSEFCGGCTPHPMQ